VEEGGPHIQQAARSVNTNCVQDIDISYHGLLLFSVSHFSRICTFAFPQKSRQSWLRIIPCFEAFRAPLKISPRKRKENKQLHEIYKSSQLQAKFLFCFFIYSFHYEPKEGLNRVHKFLYE